MRRIHRGVELNFGSIALLTSSNDLFRAERARKPPVTTVRASRAVSPGGRSGT